MRLSRIAGGVTAGALLCAPAALAHQGDPNFESRVERVVPAFSGISARVLNFDDALELRARGRRVLVFGYDGEPYAAIAADGTVRVNVNSPAYYLNRDRWGTAELPASVRKRDGRPRWQVIRENGTLLLARPSDPLDGEAAAAPGPRQVAANTRFSLTGSGRCRRKARGDRRRSLVARESWRRTAGLAAPRARSGCGRRHARGRGEAPPARSSPATPCASLVTRSVGTRSRR
jgi:hypothetical protein